jgi:hypothetical protein
MACKIVTADGEIPRLLTIVLLKCIGSQIIMSSCCNSRIAILLPSTSVDFEGAGF